MISQAEAEQSDLTQRKASEQQGLGANRGNLADAETSEKEMKTYLEEAGMGLPESSGAFRSPWGVPQVIQFFIVFSMNFL